jgi:hypothetical protein
MPGRLRVCAVHLFAAVAIATGCAPAKPKSQATLGGREVDLQELTPGDVARAVQIMPRAADVVFQAPPIQTTKMIDLRRAGEEMGVNLGTAERVRFGYLFGVLDRASGVRKDYLLFQSNFVIGNDRYASVSLANGQPLQFTVSRAPDPCVPNCFPVVEALIVSLPDQVLRDNASNGLALRIVLTSGEAIALKGVPAYVQGYLQAIDAYRPPG